MYAETRSSCAIRRHRGLILLLAAYAAVVLPVAQLYGRFPGDLGLEITSFSCTLVFALIGLLIALLGAARSDPRQPGRAIARWWRSWWPEHGLGAVIASVALPVLMTTFLIAKLLIPEIQPYSWDRHFAELDRLLHGIDPWRHLQPALGQPQLTRALSLVYTAWFLLMFGAWTVWALTDHPQRMRFLMSFALCWILLGTVAATLFSSAGPVFYAEMTGDPAPFGAQMAYLRGIGDGNPILSLRIRDKLWAAYVTGNAAGGSGISAMPSLHVAIATLCAISSWYVSWRIGVAMTLYAVVIFLGSIHLGWHYAVDGYVSIVAVAAIWVGVGKALRFRAEIPASANPIAPPAVARSTGAP
jgi:hypothetical protein